MKLYLILIVITGVYSECIFETPLSWNNPNEIQDIPCGIPYTITWTDVTPVGAGLDSYLYESINNSYVTTLYSDSVGSLNESQTYTFSCDLAGSTPYQIIMRETPYTQNAYTCRTKQLKITKCGNGVLDFNEECDPLLDPLCLQEQCKCSLYQASDKCCDVNCMVNGNVFFNTSVDLSGKTLTVNGSVTISNSILTVDSDSHIKADCLVFENGVNVFVDAKNVEGGSSIVPFKSDNCSVGDVNVTVVGLKKCIEYEKKQRLNSLEIFFVQKCTNESKSNIKLIAGATVGSIAGLIIVFIIITNSNKTLRNKVYPWRNRKIEKDIEESV